MDSWTGEIVFCMFKAILWSIPIGLFNGRLLGWIMIWGYYGIKIVNILSDKEKAQQPPRTTEVIEPDAEGNMQTVTKKLAPSERNPLDYITIDEAACEEFGCEIPTNPEYRYVELWNRNTEITLDEWIASAKSWAYQKKNGSYLKYLPVGAGNKVVGPILDQIDTKPWELRIGAGVSRLPYTINFLIPDSKEWLRTKGYLYTDHLKHAKQYHESIGEKFLYRFEDAYAEAEKRATQGEDDIYFRIAKNKLQEGIV